MRRFLGLSLTLLLLLAPALGANAADAAATTSSEQQVKQVAARLVEATATLRIHWRRTVPAEAMVAGQRAATDEVTVCSAVGVGPGLLATFATAPAAAKFRVTLPGGEQAEARLAVTDHYSGLSLLEIGAARIATFETAAAVPAIGATLLSASAAGLEEPVISRGVLGGADRSLPGAGLPPLLQCDLRTTDTSSGAAVVDAGGQLVGIVAATANQHAGWTYAVPARHVDRLLRARVDGQLVVLERRRPIVGLTLRPGAEEGVVEVERVADSGPAAAAGVQQLDRVLEADGRRVRSAYQVVDLVLKKQPGDTVALLLRRDGRDVPITIVLEGGTLLEQPPQANVAGIRIGPALNVRALSDGVFELRNRRPPSPEVAVGSNDAAEDKPRDELSMLRAQLSAFARVIEHLQTQLEQRTTRELELEQQLRQLTEEVERLRNR